MIAAPNQWTLYAAILVLATWAVCRLLGIPVPFDPVDDKGSEE